ncbi:MAG: GNAT family N-acetyltransferase [Pseudomonadota bacterium]
MLVTERLTLRAFRKADAEDFAALHADPLAMRDYGVTFSRDHSDARLDRIIAAWRHDGYGRYAVFLGEHFAGYVGVMHRASPDHPLGAHDEIGWRLSSRFWGRGIATEAASAVLEHTSERLGQTRILAYTAQDNLASQAVMTRLGLIRMPDLDFATPYPPYFDTWRGLVWRVPPHFGGME